MKKYYRILLEDNLEIPTNMSVLKDYGDLYKYESYFDDFNSLEDAEKEVEEILNDINNEYFIVQGLVIIEVYKKD